MLSIATFTAALYANPNYDGEENHKKRVQQIEEFTKRMNEHTREAIQKIYGKDTVDVDEPDWDDPFFAAMNLPYDPKTGKPNPDYVKPDWMR